MEINIDISNYEEYLLSAVDGELSGHEMAALELFLQQHPHIREEMALLESVRLAPDREIQFDSKSELYHESIQMLDYVDNELHGTEKQAFEELIRRDVNLSKELNLLQQARLQPDLNLRFENKKTLYRHNRSTIRPIWWWSAAAAVVAGVAIWVLPVLPGKEGVQVAVNKVNNGQLADSQQSGTGSETSASNQTQTSNNQSITNGQQPGSLSSTGKQLLASNKPAERSKPNASVNSKPGTSVKDIAANGKPGVPGKPAVAVNSVGNNPIVADNSNPGLSKLAQPVTTSGEVVKQLQDKMNEQQEQIAAAVANPVQKAPVLANAAAVNTNNNKVSEIVTAPAPVQGELVVSVTMNGDSKLLNGVANVARFFSRKKK
jgi:anti-sigma factor RsiW